MSRDRIEKLGTLFLAVFSTALAAQLVSTGIMEDPLQWAGAVAAVLGGRGYRHQELAGRNAWADGPASQRLGHPGPCSK